MSHPLMVPMGAHVAWAAFLYVLLTVARAPAVWGVGRRADGSNPWSKVEPRISANLSNQFEWPLFFHVACVLLIVGNDGGGLARSLAWTFVAGRVLHSLVQIPTGNVRLRGVVFTVNFLAVLGMWAVVVANAFATQATPLQAG
ncbi:MAPEG family protein [Lysobacter changpingensis]|uniref:MAPEG family protein n=1 Tax=Lysobacter changpingensis TaxID=2792784 RepID=UPI001A8E482F|nr:MAPEG family protein [Lysobacter changpingensis]